MLAVIMVIVIGGVKTGESKVSKLYRLDFSALTGLKTFD